MINFVWLDYWQIPKNHKLFPMKNHLKIFILFFFLLTLSAFAQNVTDASGKKQGHWIKLDDDKKKLYEGNFVDNIPVGKFTYYYDIGIPWSITIFSNNGKVAHTQMFDGGGLLTGEGKYVNEKKDSLWKFYSRDGKLLSIENYSNGEIAEEKNWKNGVLEGVCKKYFESGQLKYQGAYVNNKVEGKAIFYHPSGKMSIEGVYKNDLKEGPWKYYKEDGTLERTDEYVNGLFQGKKDPNVIPKEQVEKERKLSEQFEVPDPFMDR